MDRPARERLFSPAFVALVLAELAYFTGTGMALFVIPLYVTGPVGGDAAGAGLAVGAFALSALVLRPFAGRASDRFGRRPLLFGGALLAAITLALLAITDSLAVIVALRLLTGVAEAAFFVAGFAALADLAPASRVGEALSYNSLGLYLGLALGPVLGEALMGGLGFAGAWVGAAVVVALGMLPLLVVGETRPGSRTVTGRLRILHRPAIPISIGFAASLVAVGGFLALAPLQAERVGMTLPSLAFLVYGIVVVVGRVAFARVPDRLPSLPLGAASLVAMAAGLAVMAAWASVAGLLAGVVLIALGVIFSTPAFFSAVFATASASERGLASGTASAAVDLGLGFGPIVLGAAAAAAGMPWAFALGAAVAVAGAVWTLHLSRARARRTP